MSPAGLADAAAALPAPGVLLGLALAYARIQACLLTLPGFGERLLTARVKVAVAMALTPLFAQPAAVPDGLPIVAVAAEMATGAMLGLFVRLLAFALDIAATALAQNASLSQILGISEDMPPHPIGNLLHLAGLATLFALGLPVMVCRLLADSFQLRPPGAWPQAGDVVGMIVPLLADSFALAMVLASPFILGGLLFQLLSGVVARVMPALPIVFLLAPAAILVALIALAIVTPSVLGLWADHVLGFSLGEGA
ncbi:flagellar biosynthetic protein FliR [Paracoccus endophyticus]|uniref:flagellar biosynthetic protein FliR n=1 Tax=Paracoccus endophyticus TaxID=2233774 RepID=UPI001F0C5785|nr:flagellar biosynthetic protein FliR [Paracoccus endophyticus]